MQFGLANSQWANSQWANSALNESGDNTGWPLKCHSQKFGGSGNIEQHTVHRQTTYAVSKRGNLLFLEILPNDVLIKGKVYKHNLLF